MAHQHLRLDGGLRGRFAIGRLLAHEHGAKGSFAAMSAQNLEADGIEPGAEEGGGLVAGRCAEDGDECLLRQLFGLCGIGDAAAEETEDRLFVARKKSAEGIRFATGEGEHQLFVALRGLGTVRLGISGRFVHEWPCCLRV